MAFKMKNPSMAKLTKAAGDNRVAMKMKKEAAAKMKKESAMKKAHADKESMAKLMDKASAMKLKKDSPVKADIPEVTITDKKPVALNYNVPIIGGRRYKKVEGGFVQADGGKEFLADSSVKKAGGVKYKAITKSGRLTDRGIQTPGRYTTDSQGNMKMVTDREGGTATKMKKESSMKMGHKSATKMGHKSAAKLKDGDKMAKAFKEGPKSTKGKTKFKGGMLPMKPGDLTPEEKRKREDKAFKDRNRPIKEIGSGRGLKPFDPSDPKVNKRLGKSATKFNAKLKAASKAGKLSGKFKEAVDASPVKMKKSPAKLAKSLKEAAKITKAQLQGKKITVVDGGSKMAKRAKADYEKQQKAKADKAKKKAEFKRVEAENIKRSREKAKNLGMTMKEYEKMLKRKQRKEIFGF